MLDELKIIADNDAPVRTGDVVGEEHTGSHSTINRARLSQPGAQLADLLSGTSGVQQSQSGGFGTYSSVTVRAASAAQTDVYLDGILLNSGGESVIDLSTLEILNLSSVDIYKGGAPLQLGHASMGGAVNLNTQRNDDEGTSRLRLGVGSFSYSSLLAAHQATSGKWDWTTTLSRQQSDNDFPFTHDNATPLNPLDDRRLRRRNNDVERNSVLLKTGHQSTVNLRTDLLLQIAERDSGVSTSRNSSASQARYETRKNQIQLSQIVDQWAGWNTRHTLYWHGSDSVYDDSESQVGLGEQYIDTEIRTIGAKTYWEKFLSLGTWGVSLDLRDESLNLEDELNSNENFTADRQLVNATSHLVILDEGDRWMVTPAVRWQHSQRRGTSTAIGVPDTQLEQDESELGLQLGLAYSLTQKLTFNANAGNYHREPSFHELFGSIGAINGNTNLDAESGINTDIGITYDTGSLQLEMALFHNDHDNLILNSFDSIGIGRPRNTGKAQTTGLELSSIWAPAKNWHFSASATFQNPKNRDPFEGYQNKILPGEARRTGFARLAYQHGNFGYWYEWQTRQGRFFDSSNTLAAPDTTIQSIGMKLEKPRWNLSARLQNIQDVNIEDFSRSPKPGRTFFIAITQKF
ncbi:MAG: TonB-dependent receptor [Granulosicoccus sp.]